MEKFLTAVLVTFGLVILHNISSSETTEVLSSEMVLSEVSFQPSILLRR
jgi:hypothetical protein